jgi:hypothetical protein
MLKALLTACSLPQRVSRFSARAKSLAVSGSSNCLFVGSIARAVKGMTDTSNPPLISHLGSDLSRHATNALKKPALAKKTCVTVALW